MGRSAGTGRATLPVENRANVRFSRMNRSVDRSTGTTASQWPAHDTVSPCHPTNLFTHTVSFCPPKPKEFERHTSTPLPPLDARLLISRATLGT